MKANEVLAKLHKPVDPSLEVLWKTTVSELHGLFVPAFGVKQKAQLKTRTTSMPIVVTG